MARTPRARTSSPRYPNIPLSEAISLAAKIFLQDRTNPMDRSVAAKHMGFSGLTGSSDRALAALMHFGLLEKAGKGEVQVTQTALAIFHPDSTQERVSALLTAATSPSLFKQLREKYGDSKPTEENLKSYLSRLGFLSSAVPAAARSFLDTCTYLEEEGATKSGSLSSSEVAPPTIEDRELEDEPVQGPVIAPHQAVPSATPFRGVGATLNDIKIRSEGGTITLEAVLDLKGLEKLSRQLDALKMLLSDK